jgi:hypothetical protein
MCLLLSELPEGCLAKRVLEGDRQLVQVDLSESFRQTVEDGQKSGLSVKRNLWARQKGEERKTDWLRYSSPVLG